MHFSLYSIALKNYDLKGAIRFASELGFDAIEIRGRKGFHISPNEYDRKSLNEIKELLNSWNLRVSGISGYTTLTLANESERQKAAYEVKEWLELVAYLGGDFYRVNVPLPKDATREQAFNWAIKSLRKCLKLCEEYGIRLALENHGDSLVDSAENTKTLLETINSAYLGIIYDPGNLFIIGERNFKNDIKLLSSYIINVHVKDVKQINKEEYREVLLGEGEIDWRSIIRELIKRGYNGYLSVEYEVIYRFGELLPPTEVGIRHYLAALKRITNEITYG